MYLRPLLAIVALCLSMGMAAAQEDRSIVIEEFAADIRVLPTGFTEVTETLQIDFRGSWQGLIRDIALNHETAAGRPVRLDLEVDRVTDEAGTPLRYETRRRGNVQEVKFWVPGAENAIRTAVIHYRIRNVLRFFGEFDEEAERVPSAGIDEAWDELYWNVTGNDWDMPIRNARARISLPEGIQGMAAWAYTGPAGSDAQDAAVMVDDNVVDVRTNAGLGPREGLTVSVVWAPGAVHRTIDRRTAIDRIRDWWPLGLPVVAFGFMFPLWRQKGREPRRGSIVVRYEPPEGMSPAEVGTLVDHRAEMHDITATLVDLAVRGYLLIEEKEERGMLGLRTTKEYYFHQTKPRSEWQELEPYERLYLQALFASISEPASVGDHIELMRAAKRASREAKADGRRFNMSTFLTERQAAVSETEATSSDLLTVKLSDLNNRFYAHLEGIRSAIYQRLIGRGYYIRRPDKVVGTYIFAGFAILVLGFFAFVDAMDGIGFVGAPIPVAMGFGVAVAIVWGFGGAMRARTAAGVRVLEEALGFKEFLERVESDRYKRMITSPDMFERYLPYAMAFKVERRWAAAFDDLYTSPPNWYVGTGMGTFHASTFARDLGAMTSRVSSTTASSPSSSGSSGSGGGGSSGGGSGGGGGRGF
jgi:hypothetical protein